MKNRVVRYGIALLALASLAAQAESIDAARIYTENCAICHGDKGDANTAAQNGLTPPPRNFTTTEAAMELSRERMIYAVTNGRRGTAIMAHKGRLSPAEIEAVVDYVRENFMRTPVETPSDEPPLLRLGEAVYTQNCSVCHGDKGNTAYWARNGLNPPPRDFTGQEAKSILTRKRMITSVTHGREGTGMQPFKSRLSAQEIEAVVTFIRYKFMGVSPEHDSGLVPRMQTEATPTPPPSHTAPQGHTPAATSATSLLGGTAAATTDTSQEPSADMSLPLPEGLKGDPLKGRDFYMKNCFTCHGIKGDGNGPRAYFNIPRPRNFTSAESRRLLNRPRIFKSITEGRLGTVMPAWGKVLDEQQIANIAEFVYQAFIEDATPGGVAGAGKKKAP